MTSFFHSFYVRRIMGFVIDYAIVGFVVLLVAPLIMPNITANIDYYYTQLAIEQSVESYQENLIQLTRFTTYYFMLNTLIFYIYYLTCEVIFQSTPGKLFMGLKVSTRNFWKLLVRSLVLFVFTISIILNIVFMVLWFIRKDGKNIADRFSGVEIMEFGK